jgi:hypothetical protein
MLAHRSGVRVAHQRQERQQEHQRGGVERHRQGIRAGLPPERRALGEEGQRNEREEQQEALRCQPVADPRSLARLIHTPV